MTSGASTGNLPAFERVTATLDGGRGGAGAPYWRGQDTGYASWRSQVWGRWATAGAREPFGDVETYREVAQRAIAWGAALEVEDAVLVAVLTRALADAFGTRDAEPWRSDLLRAAAWRAARYGIGGDLVLARGNGAVRQRRRFEETQDLQAVVDDLAEVTESTWA